MPHVYAPLVEVIHRGIDRVVAVMKAHEPNLLQIWLERGESHFQAAQRAALKGH